MKENVHQAPSTVSGTLQVHNNWVSNGGRSSNSNYLGGGTGITNNTARRVEETKAIAIVPKALMMFKYDMTSVFSSVFFSERYINKLSWVQCTKLKVTLSFSVDSHMSL